VTPATLGKALDLALLADEIEATVPATVPHRQEFLRELRGYIESLVRAREDARWAMKIHARKRARTG
jgi:hypothetical protein